MNISNHRHMTSEVYYHHELPQWGLSHIFNYMKVFVSQRSTLGLY